MFVVSFLSLILAHSVYASEEKDDLNLDLSKAEIIYEDDEIKVGSFGNDPEIAKKIEESPTSVTVEESVCSGGQGQITPFKTVIGPGGKVTIDAGTSGRIIYWSVKPSTKWPWVFDGNIHLRYYSGFKRNAPLSGFGGLGSTYSSYVEMKRNKGGEATLTGTVYSTNNKYYKVMPGASVHFRYNW